MGGLFDLTGKRVLVTGAAGGIGALLARRLLLDEGCELILVDRDAAGLEKLRASLEEDGGVGCKVEIHQVDLASRASIDRLVETLADLELDVLINNAGLAPGASFDSMQLEDVQRVLAVNLDAVVHLTHRLLPKLLERERAHIVNVASASGLAAPGGMVAYATSKFGVVGFSEALRAELHDRGVGVSAVCPAFVKTDIVKKSRLSPSGDPRADAERIERLDRFVKRNAIAPERVARVIVDAVKRNRARVVLGGTYRVLLGLRFFFPGLADWINRRNYARLKQRGLLR